MSFNLKLDSGFQGPRVISSYLKKMKSPGWNRLISYFNKRFFVLDLDTLKFYYTTKSNNQLTDAKMINLEDISEVRSAQNIDKYPQDMPFAFEIITASRKYMLFAVSAMIRDMWLEAFSAIEKLDDGKKLFERKTADDLKVISVFENENQRLMQQNIRMTFDKKQEKKTTPKQPLWNVQTKNDKFKRSAKGETSPRRTSKLDLFKANSPAAPPNSVHNANSKKAGSRTENNSSLDRNLVKSINFSTTSVAYENPM